MELFQRGPKKASATMWIILVVLLIIVVLLAIFVIMPLFKPAQTYSLNVMLNAPLQGVSASLNEKTITLDVKNAGSEAISINAFHLTFNEPSTASCKKELNGVVSLGAGMTLPIKAEDCNGIDLKKEKLDATASIAYIVQGSSEPKTSSGTIWTFGPIQ